MSGSDVLPEDWDEMTEPEKRSVVREALREQDTLQALVRRLLEAVRCDYQDDGVRGDIGGPCRKLRGHDGDHDPFERVTPDSLRATFGLDALAAPLPDDATGECQVYGWHQHAFPGPHRFNGYTDD